LIETRCRNKNLKEKEVELFFSNKPINEEKAKEKKRRQNARRGKKTGYGEIVCSQGVKPTFGGAGTNRRGL